MGHLVTKAKRVRRAPDRKVHEWSLVSSSSGRQGKDEQKNKQKLKVWLHQGS